MPTDDKLSAFDAGDVRLLVESLSTGTKRVERLRLSAQNVWIKRYGRDRKPAWTKLHAGFAALCGIPALKPSPDLSAKGMVSRELRRMQAFKDQGFLTATVVC